MLTIFLLTPASTRFSQLFVISRQPDVRLRKESLQVGAGLCWVGWNWDDLGWVGLLAPKLAGRWRFWSHSVEQIFPTANSWAYESGNGWDALIHTLVYLVLYIYYIIYVWTYYIISICKLSLVFGWLTSEVFGHQLPGSIEGGLWCWSQGHSSGCSVRHCHELHGEFLPQQILRAFWGSSIWWFVSEWTFRSRVSLEELL